MNILKIIFISIFLFVSSMAVAGGGWVPAKGEGYFKLGQSMQRAPQYYSPDGHKIDITTISLYFTSVYGEYGFANRWAAVAFAPLLARTTLNKVKYEPSRRSIPGDSYTGIGDILAGVKYSIIEKGPVVVAGSVLAGLPTGNPSGGETRILQTGDGEFNQLVKLEASGTVPNFPMYFTGTGGFNNRTQGFSDEVHYGLEAGWQPVKKIWWIVRFYGYSSLNNGSETAGAVNAIFSNNASLVALETEAAFKLTEKTGFTLSAGTPLAGQRVLAAPFFGAGIYFKKLSKKETPVSE